MEERGAAPTLCVAQQRLTEALFEQRAVRKIGERIVPRDMFGNCAQLSVRPSKRLRYLRDLGQEHRHHDAGRRDGEKLADVPDYRVARCDDTHDRVEHGGEYGNRKPNLDRLLRALARERDEGNDVQPADERQYAAYHQQGKAAFVHQFGQHRGVAYDEIGEKGGEDHAERYTGADNAQGFPCRRCAYRLRSQD